MKKRVKRFGVMGGGFLGFLLPVLEGGPSGDDGGICDIGSSWSRYDWWEGNICS